MSDTPHPLHAALADRYRLERELGRGGMATVHLAHDLRHDRPVALKVLHPDLAHALGPERFQREIHTAARLQHPHILTVLDSGETAGQLWFTMPYVEGESLRARIDRERQLPVDEAVRIAREAAEALDYAHRHGIVHRDVKPDNILLSDGHALVADFGIARALAPGGEQLTATGTSVGTAAYMSPEQAAGERDVDGRSDIFSLGVVLYEMLAGVTPFAAATPQATIARRFTEDAPPLRNARSSVPPHLEQTVQRALARTAADRFTTARAFADALAATPTAAAATTATAAAGAPPHGTAPMERMRRSPALMTLVIGLLLGGGALFAWTRVADDAPASADLRAASVEPGTVRIAVLPFENLGDTAEAYFAAGVTDAVRGKLAAIDGLEVIARSSSDDYRGSTKTPAQIADELGVDYLLTGQVRWVRQPDGTSRVQVSPELVQIADGVARTRWGQPFNAPLDDVFAVQGQIAGRVTNALDVELGASERQQLAERPTDNLEAYDLWLQADAIAGADPASMRQIVALLERAVELDPQFGAAWARLSRARGLLWVTTPIKPTLQSVHEPLERAMVLAPDAVETWRTRIANTSNVDRDLARSLELAEAAVARHPGDPELLRALGIAAYLTGDMARAMPALQRAAALDPRNPRTLRATAAAHLTLGDWEAARTLYRRVLALAPGDVVAAQALAMTWLYEGDLAGARRILASVEPPTGREPFLAELAVYGDYWWVLERAQQDTVLSLGVEGFSGDAGSRALVFAQIFHHRGDTVAARRWADSAARDFRALGDAVEQDPQIPGLIGLAHAYAGRHDEARRWLDRSLAATFGQDSSMTVYAYELLARGLLLAGDRAGALDALEKWAELRGPQAPGFARLHPQFATLRGEPRYERIAGRPQP